MNIHIRKATPGDIPGIFDLVKQLAIYENAPDEVVTSPEIYKEDFKNGSFDAFVAETGGELVGMALYYWAYSTWKGKFLWLEDFIVRHDQRGSGVGQMLFESMLNLCTDLGVPQLKWQVLDWNEPAIRFYKKYNYEWQREWLTYRILM